MAGRPGTSMRPVLWLLYALMVIIGSFFATYGLFLRGEEGFLAVLSFWSIAICIGTILLGWLIGRSVYISLLSGGEKTLDSAAAGFGIGVAFAMAGLVVMLLGMWPWLWIAALVLLVLGVIAAIAMLGRYLGAVAMVLLTVVFAGIGVGVACWLRFGFGLF